MRAGTRERNVAAERRERERYVILQHLHSLEKETAGMSVRKIAGDLGFPHCSAEVIVEHLITTGYLVCTPGIPCIRTSRRGAEYIERLAGRRRSLRV